LSTLEANVSNDEGTKTSEFVELTNADCVLRTVDDVDEVVAGVRDAAE
jgi:hypothetical protein